MAWLLRRLALSAVLLWLVASVVFLSVFLIPGDPVEILLSQEGGGVSRGSIDAVRAERGLDRPLPLIYVERVSRLMRFDFGVSDVDGSPIGAQLATRLPRTLELIGAASLLSLLIGIPAGVAASLRPRGVFDRVASTLSGVAQSLPVFVIGSILILILAQMLRWVPAGGFVDFAADPRQHIMLLLLPATAIAIGLTAIVFRVTRSSMLEVLPSDYVRTAEAMGLSAPKVIFSHALRTALMPVVTVFALNLGALLGGTVLVEYVFNWPGLSGMLVSAVNARDYSAITAVVFVTAALFILLNLVVDVLFSLLDPRVRK